MTGLAFTKHLFGGLMSIVWWYMWNYKPATTISLRLMADSIIFNKHDWIRDFLHQDLLLLNIALLPLTRRNIICASYSEISFVWLARQNMQAMHIYCRLSTKHHQISRSVYRSVRQERRSICRDLCLWVTRCYEIVVRIDEIMPAKPCNRLLCNNNMMIVVTSGRYFSENVVKIL